MAAPRTPGCSIKSLEKLKQWEAFQAQLAKEAAAYQRSRPHGPPPLLLLGDSITEALRGTAIGEVVKRTAGIEEVTAGFLGWQKPLIFAISADETQHLLWRLQVGGELAPALCDDPRLVMHLLIGTNNIGNAQHSAEATARGILAVAHELLGRTRGRLLISALLPRSQITRSAKHNFATKTFTSRMPSVRRANAIVNHTVVTALALRHPGRVRMVDCGDIFLAEQAEPGEGGPALFMPSETREALMPDALHPNVRGTQLWTACLRRALEPWRRLA